MAGDGRAAWNWSGSARPASNGFCIYRLTNREPSPFRFDFFFLFSLFLFFSSSWIQPNRMSINRYSQRDGKKRFCQSNQEHFFFLFRSCCCAFPRRVTKGVSPNLTDTTARGSDGWNEEKIPSSGRTRRSSGPITPNGRQKEMRRIRMMFDLKGKIK